MRTGESRKGGRVPTPTGLRKGARAQMRTRAHAYRKKRQECMYVRLAQPEKACARQHMRKTGGSSMTARGEIVHWCKTEVKAEKEKKIPVCREREV